MIDLRFDPASFRLLVDTTVKNYLKAAKQAVGDVTKDAEKALEAKTAAAGLGRLSKAWSSKQYPRGDKLAYAPTGAIYAKGKDRTLGALKAYSEGGIIKPRGSGKFLAIPLPAAGKGTRANPLSVASWVSKNGPLTFIPARGARPAMLVKAGRVGTTGRFRNATARQQQTGRGVSIVPIFLLIPQISVSKRFDIRSTLAPFQNNLASVFEAKVRAIPNSTP